MGLNNREVALGGYISHITMFIPQDPTRMPMPVLLYVATPSNQHWLGHASSEHIANQVLESRGDKGHNVEYVLKLAEWIRDKLVLFFFFFFFFLLVLCKYPHHHASSAAVGVDDA